jgi:hypothetical protein
MTRKPAAFDLDEVRYRPRIFIHPKKAGRQRRSRPSAPG